LELIRRKLNTTSTNDCKFEIYVAMYMFSYITNKGIRVRAY